MPLVFCFQVVDRNQEADDARRDGATGKTLTSGLFCDPVRLRNPVFH